MNKISTKPVLRLDTVLEQFLNGILRQELIGILKDEVDICKHPQISVYYHWSSDPWSGNSWGTSLHAPQVFYTLKNLIVRLESLDWNLDALDNKYQWKQEEVKKILSSLKDIIDTNRNLDTTKKLRESPLIRKLFSIQTPIPLDVFSEKVASILQK